MKSTSLSPWLCGINNDRLPYPWGLDFAHMRQHTIEVHALGLNREIRCLDAPPSDSQLERL